MKNEKQFPRIQNKKAHHFYYVLESYTAGIQLLGLDVKHVRLGKVSIGESFGSFINNELYLTNFRLAEREGDRTVDIKFQAQRKLLLNRKELDKLEKRIVEKGNAIVPLQMYFDQNGRVKVEIALVKGKHEFDKRQSLKQRESHREMDREMKASINKKWQSK